MVGAGWAAVGSQAAGAGAAGAGAGAAVGSAAGFGAAGEVGREGWSFTCRTLTTCKIVCCPETVSTPYRRKVSGGRHGLRPGTGAVRRALLDADGVAAAFLVLADVE